MLQESPQREHIRRIRQEKFGLADDGTRLNENALAQDLGNALHRLSQDLYSNVHHFILELIQNAEDSRAASNPDSMPSSTEARTNENPQTKTSDAKPTQRTPQSRGENRQRGTRRIVTYVQPEEREVAGGENAEARSAEATERIRRGEVAENFVVAWEKAQGRAARRIGGNNEGYDIESFDPKTGCTRFIEVKGIDGSWEDEASVGMTAPQFEACRERGNDFWLYVVEHAMSESPPQPHCFKNPVASVTSYRFDKNWRQLLVAEE